MARVEVRQSRRTRRLDRDQRPTTIWLIDLLEARDLVEVVPTHATVASNGFTEQGLRARGPRSPELQAALSHADSTDTGAA